MVTQALHRRQVALGRALSRRDLPSTCVVESVDTSGNRTPVATVRCRVVYPRAEQGQAYPDDQREASVLIPADAADPPDSGYVVVTDPVAGTATYRIVHAPPARSDDLLRAITVVEAR